MPSKNTKVNFKALFEEKKKDISESLNKISEDVLENMHFTVSSKEIVQIETRYGLTDCYMLLHNGRVYTLLTKSKVFRQIWEENVEEGMILRFTRTEQGWMFYA